MTRLRELTQNIADMQAKLTVAEDGLREAANPSCGYIEDAGDGFPSFDADASRRVAEGALKRLEAMS
jgi:hypothetical protein